MTDEIAEPDPRPIPLSKNRDFILFLTSRGAMVAGFQTHSVAVGWHVYTRTGDVMNIALIGLFMFLPFLALFLPAGVVADRVDRRHIISIATVAHAIAIALTGLWLAGGSAVIWPVFGLLAINGTAQAFMHPANQAMLPGLVPRAQFSRAFAANSTVAKSAQLGGPALGGLLIALIDTGAYAVIAVLYLTASLSIRLIRTDLRIEAPDPVNLDTILGGIHHIWNTKIVLAAVSVDLFAVLLGGVMGLLPVIAADLLNVGPEALGVMRAMPAAGALLVGALLARFSLPGHIGQIFFLSLGTFGVSIIVMSVSTSFLLTLAALFVYGASDMISVFIRHTLVQMGTPDRLRGRVSAVNAVSINASNQLGDFRAGSMAALLGTPAAIALGGIATLMIGGLWFKAFPEFRSLRSI